MTKKNLLMLVIILCLAALAYITLTTGPSSPPPLPSFQSPGASPAGGKQKIEAPDFTLETLDGKSTSLSSLKGQVVILNFWSASCGPCLIEMPALTKLASAMSGKPFTILGITPDPKAEAAYAAKELRLNFPVLLDSTARVASAYGVSATPETFIIAPDGTVDNMVLGAANWADPSVIEYMNKLLPSSTAPR